MTKNFDLLYESIICEEFGNNQFKELAKKHTPAVNAQAWIDKFISRIYDPNSGIEGEGGGEGQDIFVTNFQQAGQEILKDVWKSGDEVMKKEFYDALTAMWNDLQNDPMIEYKTMQMQQAAMANPVKPQYSDGEAWVGGNSFGESTKAHPFDRWKV